MKYIRSIFGTILIVAVGAAYYLFMFLPFPKRWKEFTKALVECLVLEAVTTSLMVLGGTLVWHGKSRIEAEENDERKN